MVIVIVIFRVMGFGCIQVHSLLLMKQPSFVVFCLFLWSAHSFRRETAERFGWNSVAFAAESSLSLNSFLGK